MPIISKELTQDGKLFVKTFLIDTSRAIRTPTGQRDWGVSPNAIDIYAHTFVGRPVVLVPDPKLTPEQDYHPWYSLTEFNVEKDLAEAEKYAIGHIQKVTHESETYDKKYGGTKDDRIDNRAYFAIWEVEDADAKQFIMDNWDNPNVIPAVSPAIYRYGGSELEAEQFLGIHLAVVPEGAYGPKAKEVARCAGSEYECIPQLMAASVFQSAIDSDWDTDDRTREDFLKSVLKFDATPRTKRDWSNIQSNAYPLPHEGKSYCVKRAFSSLLAQNGNSSNNNMSFSTPSITGVHNSTTGTVKSPAPRTIGTNTFQSPTGQVMGTQTTGAQPTTQQPQRITLKLKSPKRLQLTANQNQEEEEKQKQQQIEQQQATNGNVENKTVTATENTAQVNEQPKQEQPQQEQPKEEVTQPEAKIDQATLKELEELRGKVSAQERRWQLVNIIPRDLFIDNNGRLREKDWQKAIDDAIAKNLPDDIIEEYYRLKKMEKQFPEIQVKAQSQKRENTGRLGGSTLSSSQNTETEFDKTVRLLKLVNRMNGGSV